jgi:hypothetical protein
LLPAEHLASPARYLERQWPFPLDRFAPQYTWLSKRVFRSGDDTVTLSCQALTI